MDSAQSPHRSHRRRLRSRSWRDRNPRSEALTNKLLFAAATGVVLLAVALPGRRGGSDAGASDPAAAERDALTVDAPFPRGVTLRVPGEDGTD